MKYRIFPQLRSRILLFAAIAFCATATLLISPLHGSAQQNGLPPIIDRELFFGDPEISGAQLSPDGKFIAFVKPFKGTRNVWVKRTEAPFESAKPVTADPTRPIPAYFWSRDGKYILFVQDKAGDENYLVYAVNPNDAPTAGQDVPAARNLTDAKGVRAEIFAVLSFPIPTRQTLHLSSFRFPFPGIVTAYGQVTPISNSFPGTNA